jgi:hypothetical protein
MMNFNDGVHRGNVIPILGCRSLGGTTARDGTHARFIPLSLMELQVK